LDRLPLLRTVFSAIARLSYLLNSVKFFKLISRVVNCQSLIAAVCETVAGQAVTITGDNQDASLF